MDIGPEPLNKPDSYISACKQQTNYSEQPLKEELKAQNLLRKAEDYKLF